MTTINESGNDPQVWFTSDTHFGHVNILKFNAEQRPFKDTDHMDEEIIRRWNAVVSPKDTVYHLGDIALGPIDKSLPKIARLNGHKIAVLGNHDRPFMRAGKHDEQRWWARYKEVFQEVRGWEGILVDIGPFLETVKLSHFPYTGDHTPEDRHADVRPHDIGTPLIHGHTHSTDRLTYSSKGTPQIHVGMDAWDLTPVNSSQILDILGLDRG